MKKQSPDLALYERASKGAGGKIESLGSPPSHLSSSQAIKRSEKIPLPSSHIQRTQSEVQLCQEMANAERRDLNMFYRLVNGIRDRQTFLARNSETLTPPMTESERSIASIINTRNTHIGRPSFMLEAICSNDGHDNDVSPQAAALPNTIHMRLNSRHLTASESSENDQWSVSGFETNEGPSASPCLDYHQQVEHQQISSDEEEIFSLDL